MVANPIPVIRTVINESGIVYKQESSAEHASYQMENTLRESDNTPLGTPLSKTPPPMATTIPQNIGVIGLNSLTNNTFKNLLDFSKPPPNFDPAVPPPLPIVNPLASQQPPIASLQPPATLASKSSYYS